MKFYKYCTFGLLGLFVLFISFSLTKPELLSKKIEIQISENSKHVYEYNEKGILTSIRTTSLDLNKKESLVQKIELDSLGMLRKVRFISGTKEANGVVWYNEQILMLDDNGDVKRFRFSRDYKEIVAKYYDSKKEKFVKM